MVEISFYSDCCSSALPTACSSVSVRDRRPDFGVVDMRDFSVLRSFIHRAHKGHMSKDSESHRREREQTLIADRARVAADLDAAVAGASGETEQERSGDISAMPTHPADLGTDTMQSEMDAANVTRLTRELADIDAELERLRLHG
jgi:RNA polymerase-binding transcription factor DksA